MKLEQKQMIKQRNSSTLNNFVQLVNEDMELQNLLDKYEINSHYDLCAVIELITNPDDVVVLEVVIVD